MYSHILQDDLLEVCICRIKGFVKTVRYEINYPTMPLIDITILVKIILRNYFRESKTNNETKVGNFDIPSLTTTCQEKYLPLNSDAFLLSF
jgi:hypothetical protein